MRQKSLCDRARRTAASSALPCWALWSSMASKASCAAGAAGAASCEKPGATGADQRQIRHALAHAASWGRLPSGSAWPACPARLPCRSEAVPTGCLCWGSIADQLAAWGLTCLPGREARRSALTLSTSAFLLNLRSHSGVIQRSSRILVAPSTQGSAAHMPLLCVCEDRGLAALQTHKQHWQPWRHAKRLKIMEG